MSIDFERLTEDDLAELDALLATGEGRWWDAFYEDRSKPCPFFAASPDECLVEWISGGLIRPGRAVELGCGNGRNAIFLARQGFSVEAIDYSQTAIDWARDRVKEAGVAVCLKRESVFESKLEDGAYDLVYDSGCFHHIPPHRRSSYVELVRHALKPGGWFGLTCFMPEGGSGHSDEEVYQRRSMGGGLGYAQARLREVWSRGFQVRIIRQMNKAPAASGLFGEDFLWALLAHRT